MAMSFANHYIQMTPACFALLDVGIAVGGLLAYCATGFILQHGAPKQLFNLCLCCIVGAVLVLCCMQGVGRAKLRRMQRNSSDETLSSAEKEPLLKKRYAIN